MHPFEPFHVAVSSSEVNLLLEKPSQNSSQDSPANINVQTTKNRRPWLHFLIHISFMLIYSLVITAILVQQVYRTENLGPSLIYTPARHVMGYTVRPPISQTMFKLHQDPDFGDPSPELDQRWTDRLKYSSIRLTEEEFAHYNQSGVLLGDGSGYLATPTVYHDLHCLEFLHQTIYPDYYFPNDTKAKQAARNYHARHCLRDIGHSVTCGADMSIRVMQWLPDQLLPSPVDHEHECRSFKHINEWAKERAVETAVEGMVVHPILGEVLPNMLTTVTKFRGNIFNTRAGPVFEDGKYIGEDEV